METMDCKKIASCLCIGIMAGFVGIILTILMHTIQHFAFGYTLIDNATFRDVVVSASFSRRVGVLAACGLLVGVGWLMIHRYGQPLVDIKDAANNPDKQMPIFTTIVHSLLQIVTVAMGSPLGREVAPREFSAAIATGMMKFTNPDPDTRKLLLACASGAGLAAVYNAPLGATLFVLETIYLKLNKVSVAAAVLTCSTAALTARLGLGDVIQYALPQAELNFFVNFWAALAGPILALSAVLFNKSCNSLPHINRKSLTIIPVAVIAFTVIGIGSIWFPEILGNGKAGNQMTFTVSISGLYSMELFGAKWIAIVLAIFAGAYGGRITPSMMLGGTLALVLSAGWDLFLPPISEGAAAFVGAAVFLGMAQKMPLTSAIFLLELSRFSPAYLLPICICMATAWPVYLKLQKSI